MFDGVCCHGLFLGHWYAVPSWIAMLDWGHPRSWPGVQWFSDCWWCRLIWFHPRKCWGLWYAGWFDCRLGLVDCLQLSNSFELLLSDGLKRFGWCRVIENLHYILCRLNHNVGRGSIWYRCLLREEFDSIGVSFASRVVYVHVVAPIVVFGGAQVPARLGMWIPRSALPWFFVYLNLGAGWRHGCSIEIKHTVENIVRRQMRVAP